jgi:hypothetical protein
MSHVQKFKPMHNRILYEALNDFQFKIENLKAMMKSHGLLAEEIVKELEKNQLLITEIRDAIIPQDQIEEFQKSLLFANQKDYFPNNLIF